jgi:hypothetical protein
MEQFKSCEMITDAGIRKFEFEMLQMVGRVMFIWS